MTEETKTPEELTKADIDKMSAAEVSKLPSYVIQKIYFIDHDQFVDEV